MKNICEVYNSDKNHRNNLKQWREMGDSFGVDTEIRALCRARKVRYGDSIHRIESLCPFQITVFPL